MPIVTTAAVADAVELVQTYTRCWPVQENVIRDWLIPLGIEINHGYAKTTAINSEVAKKREARHLRLENVQRWTDGAEPPHAPCEQAPPKTQSTDERTRGGALS